MKKYYGTLYRSVWDISTWGMILLTAICCILPIFFDDDGLLPVIVCCLVLICVIIILKSVYYRIDGEQLIVYELFCPKAYPIKRIKSIRPTRSVLSAPATSLISRIAITFDDRSVMKSVYPLVISPVRRNDFLAQLLEINPDIEY